MEETATRGYMIPREQIPELSKNFSNRNRLEGLRKISWRNPYLDLEGVAIVQRAAHATDLMETDIAYFFVPLEEIAISLGYNMENIKDDKEAIFEIKSKIEDTLTEMLSCANICWSCIKNHGHTLLVSVDTLLHHGYITQDQAGNYASNTHKQSAYNPTDRLDP